MSLKSAYKTDIQSAVHGVWHSFEKNSDGTVPRFKLARKNRVNKKYQAAIQELYKTLGLDKDEKAATEDQVLEGMVKVFVDTILTGWENFQPEDDGVAMEFNRDNALKVFRDEAWSDLYAELDRRAELSSEYRVKELAATAKN